MEAEALTDFLTRCCRVCLSIESEMVDSSNVVENFNKTIDQLLFECANLKVSSLYGKETLSPLDRLHFSQLSFALYSIFVHVPLDAEQQ